MGQEKMRLLATDTAVYRAPLFRCDFSRERERERERENTTGIGGFRQKHSFLRLDSIEWIRRY